MVASALPSVELERGQTLDRYELVWPVARGGMARVWVARLRGKHGFEKLVALKTILPALAEQPRFRRMFLDEAKIASSIEHVNVAQILDLGEHAGRLYLVMEWVDGDSLQELDRVAELMGEELPVTVVVRVMADVCAGLHAAHELVDSEGKPLNVVHRDVSPQNVLMSSGGVVKLIDFGVVKARQRTTEETAIGIIKGKLWYMAPEQALGQPVDRRADIWAVGAILYRLLARRPVFQEQSPLATFKRLTSSRSPDPLPPAVPEALARIVRKALAFEPRRRYASAAELGAALEGLLRGPNQTTTKDVAATLDRYLGRSLAVRRQAISEALATSSPGPPRAERGGASQVKTIVDVPRRFSSEPPISLSIPSLPVASRSAPPPTLPSGSARWLASAGVVTVGLALGGLLGDRQPGLPDGRLNAAQASLPAPRATTLDDAPHRGEPSANGAPVAAVLVPPPVSLQALPVLPEASASAVQSKRAVRRKHATRPASTREASSSTAAGEPAPMVTGPSATAAVGQAPSGAPAAQ